MAPSERRRNRVMDLEAALPILAEVRKQNRAIVFANGCFDLLHAGHTYFLEQAGELGDFLVVGINTDDSVRMIKGYRRPVTPLTERAEVVAALYCVDLVIPFDEGDPHRLIAEIRPDILVKGEDWREDEIIGRDLVESAGGRVVRLPLKEGISTTGIIRRILKSFGRQGERGRDGTHRSHRHRG